MSRGIVVIPANETKEKPTSINVDGDSGILTAILSHLHYEEIRKLQKISTQFSGLLNDASYWTKLLIRKTAAVHRDRFFRLHLIDIFERLTSLTVPKYAWTGFVEHKDYQGIGDWESQSAKDCCPTCADIVEPGKALRCVLPSVAPGVYWVALFPDDMSLQRRYCSIQSSANHWLHNSFQEEALKVWDFATCHTIQRGDEDYGTKGTYLSTFKNETFSTVTIQLHRPTAKTYGQNGLIPESLMLIPDNSPKGKNKFPQRDMNWTLQLPLYQFGCYIVGGRLGGTKHYRISPETFGGHGRAISICDSGSLTAIGRFRNVPVGVYKVMVYMQGSVYGDHWTSGWLTGVPISRRARWKELLNGENRDDDRWMDEIESEDLDGVIWCMPQCWRGCYCSRESPDRNEIIPVKRIRYAPVVELGEENGVFLEAQRSDVVCWQHYESDAIAIIDDENSDVLVQVRFAEAGRDSSPTLIEYFALRRLDEAVISQQSQPETPIALSLSDSSTTSSTESSLSRGKSVAGGARGSLTSSYLPDEFWRTLLKHLHVKEIFKISLLCKSLNKSIEEEATWSGLIIDRVKATLSDGTLMPLVKTEILRPEKLERTCFDIMSPNLSQNVLICHKHAARGYSTQDDLIFYLRLPQGHYRVRGLMNKGTDIREARLEVRAVRDFEPSDLSSISYFSLATYTLLSDRTLMSDEDILDGTCQLWEGRETFTISSYQSLELMYAVGYGVIFEKLQLIREEHPKVQPRPLIVGDIDSMGQAWSLNRFSYTATPLSFAEILELGSDRPAGRYLSSSRSIDGTVLSIASNGLALSRIILPEVAPGMYEAFFTFYCHCQSPFAPEVPWQDAYYWTAMELEATLVATPRTPPGLLRDCIEYDASDADAVGLSLLESETSFHQLMTNESTCARLTSISKTIIRDDCVEGLNEYTLSPPLLVPSWSARDTHYQVYLNIRILPSVGLFIGTCGLRPHVKK